MDELLKDNLLKLYKKHPFILDNGARSSVTDKLVAKEFYKIGYNAAIDEFVDKLYQDYIYDSICRDDISFYGFGNKIKSIAEQMKKGE